MGRRLGGGDVEGQLEGRDGEGGNLKGETGDWGKREGEKKGQEEGAFYRLI